MDGVKRWAESNNLRLNATKSRELLVTRGRSPGPPLIWVKRVDQLRILGVVISSNLSISSHVDQVLGSCTSAVYALRVLKANSMSNQALHAVS